MEPQQVRGADDGQEHAFDSSTGNHKGGQKILDSAKARAQASGLNPEVVMFDHFAGRRPGPRPGEAAKKQRADLIVLGTHGRRGVRRFVLGSDAE